MNLKMSEEAARRLVVLIEDNEQPGGILADVVDQVKIELDRKRAARAAKLTVAETQMLAHLVSRADTGLQLTYGVAAGDLVGKLKRFQENAEKGVR